MSDKANPVSLTVQPWFQDHRVDGKIVLPAVETMLLLAAQCLMAHSEIDVSVMEDVRFGKFLEIPPSATKVPTLVQLAEGADDRILATLLSHVRLGTMARMKEHGAMIFAKITLNKEQASGIVPNPPTSLTGEISAKRLYRDFVPFGTHYQTLQDTLYFSDRRAWGRLKAPELPFTDPVQNIIGSPFPLDGAMHAACTLGQQFVGFPPFPVGFAKRTIYKPTQAGGQYTTAVTMTSQTDEELTFDLHIFNNADQLFETVIGLRMRNVRRVIKRPANESR